MRVLQPGGDLDLAREALGSDLRRDFLIEDLDRDLAPMFEVFGPEDGRHAPTPQFAIHGVGVGDGVPQCGQQISQGGPSRKNQV